VGRLVQVWPPSVDFSSIVLKYPNRSLPADSMKVRGVYQPLSGRSDIVKYSQDNPLEENDLLLPQEFIDFFVEQPVI
jgi:hypothetical protein